MEIGLFDRCGEAYRGFWAYLQGMEIEKYRKLLDEKKKFWAYLQGMEMEQGAMTESVLMS